MMKLMVAWLCLLFASACGQQSASVGDVDKTEPALVGSFSLAEAGRWQAQLNWNQAPRYSDTEFLEMKGTVVIHKTDGSVPTSISDMTFRADMPQHGHGTGNILPTIAVKDAETGTLDFANLLFTMTGDWRIRVTATVDGEVDVWTETIEVQ